MIKNNYNVIGVMSGTSLDGVDLANITLNYGDKWEFVIHHSETVPYPSHWIEKLKELTSYSLKELGQLDVAYTNYLAQTINEFIDNKEIKNIDAVCSHGHTALHQPEKRLTYQIGNLPILASLINQKVVCDFRVEDVALGGQGAPLVPIGDKLLFLDYTFYLNLGGFANLSFESNYERIAYDICPVNIVLNHYTNQLGLDFDDKGHLASQGELNQHLLTQLNSLKFYQQKPPKSLGLEWVRTTILSMIDDYKISIKDILRTFVEHIAICIGNELNQKTRASVLITGGGAYNEFLVKRLKCHTHNIIDVPNKEIVEYKEALIFGLLGVLRLRNEINCLKSVTGASKNHSSGKIYSP